jgi:hypothetical protein
MVLTGLFFSPLPGGSEEKPERPSYSTEVTDRDACQRHLNLINSALQEYQRRNQKLPRWLSDLTPDFIHNPDVLICPYVNKTGNVKKWKEGFGVIPVFGDSGSTYGYEFCTEKLRNRPLTTCREYKQRQMDVIGFSVPIVRCFAHRPVLNLAFDGQIYESRETWEDSFVKELSQKIVFHSVSGMTTGSLNFTVTKLIEPRDPNTDVRLLDLSRQYNASLLHLSRLDRSGKLQSAYPQRGEKVGEIEFDIRGLVHLTAANFPLSFPAEVEGIEVNQACARIRFLHGTHFKAPMGARIASYFVHTGDNRPVEIPVVYGKDVRERWCDSRQEADLHNPEVAWVSPAEIATLIGKSLRLYQTTWTNPHPNSVVKGISFVSHMTESAPFLLGITLE